MNEFIFLSDHAYDRYCERVRECSRAELNTLKALGTFSEDPPFTLPPNNGKAHGYLLIADGICLPLIYEQGRWVATTTLVRASHSEEALAVRRRNKARQRKVKHIRRDKRRSKWEGKANKRLGKERRVA